MSTHAWAAAWALLSLGAVHGLNPAMGWLFAVALGLQRGGAARRVARARAAGAGSRAGDRRGGRRSRCRSELVLPSGGVRWAAAVLLVGLGGLQLRGHRHAGLGRWRVGGLRASGRELVAWSFVVASAHGAGLMAAPFALRAVRSGVMGHAGHASHSSAALASVASVDWPTLWATSVHTAGYLLVTGVLAVVVYERAALHLRATRLDQLRSGLGRGARADGRGGCRRLRRASGAPRRAPTPYGDRCRFLGPARR